MRGSLRLSWIGLLCGVTGLVWAAAGDTSTTDTSVPGALSGLAGSSTATSQIPSITNAKTPTQAGAAGKLSPDQQSQLAAAQKGQNAQTSAQPLGTDFQKFIQESTGSRLPIYGYGMFGGTPTTFAPMEHIPVTPDYTVGPGDEVVIHAWGQVDIDYRATVDRLGSIYIPKVGSINVAGVRYQSLKDDIKTAIGRNYRNFDLEVNLGQLRSIHVYVVGEARQAGSYTISSLSTLVNALFASGGPSVNGSMRHIQVKRANRVITEFDAYDFLLKGDKSHDVSLQDGDVIFIPPVGEQVAITNGVKVPAIYEMTEHSTLKDVIALAGGMTNTAAGQKVEVDRINQHKNRSVAEFNLDTEGMQQSMADGDVIQFTAVSPRIENAVTLRGNVANPVRMPWQSGMKVSDLIPNQDMLINQDYWLKLNQEKMPNAKRMEGIIKGEHASINWDYAVVERLNTQDLTTQLIPFNLRKAVIDKDPAQDLILQPGDVITVFSMNDVAVPEEQQVRLVTIEGEVHQGGVYQALPGETLRQLVSRIGGLSPNAYLYGATFTRESTRLLQQQRIDEFVNRSESDVRKNYSEQVLKLTNPADAAALATEEQRQLDELEKMRGMKATGRVVLEIPPQAHGLQDIPDITLENGDQLIIPMAPSTVGVFGLVYNENNSFFYKNGRRVSDYLAAAGGPMRDADTGRIYVLRADGSVVSKQNTGGFFFNHFDHMRLMPGDTVVVPEKADKTPILKTFMDWTQVFFNMGIGVATLKIAGLI